MKVDLAILGTPNFLWDVFNALKTYTKACTFFTCRKNKSLYSITYASLVPLKMLRLLEVTRQSVFIIAHRYNCFECFRRLFWRDAPNYVKIEVGRG